MAIVLLENSTDSGHMFYCKFEHDQFHWCFAHLVILLQIAGSNRRTRMLVFIAIGLDNEHTSQ